MTTWERNSSDALPQLEDVPTDTDVSAILTAERLKRERQLGLMDFVRGLQFGALFGSEDFIEHLPEIHDWTSGATAR